MNDHPPIVIIMALALVGLVALAYVSTYLFVLYQFVALTSMVTKVLFQNSVDDS